MPVRTRIFAVLPLVGGLLLASGAAGKTRERLEPLADPGLSDGTEPSASPDSHLDSISDEPRAAPAPTIPNWGPRTLKPGKVTSASGGKSGAGVAKVTGMKGLKDGERLYVLNPEMNGIIAELVPRKISRKRSMAQCDIASLRPKFARAELVGKPVVREAEIRGYLKRFNVGSIATGGASDGSAGVTVGQDRNPVALAAFLSEGYRSAAFDVLTSSNLRQEVETLGAELAFFLPNGAPGSVMNWFGLRAVLTKSQRGTLVGRYPDATEVLRFKVDGGAQKIQLVVRPTFARRLPSQVSFAVTVLETRTDKLTSPDAASLGAPGALTLESETKGSGVALGGAVMPFDGFIVGMNLGLPLRQTLTVTETSGRGTTSAAGTWSRFDAESYGGVRFPRPAPGGGVTVDIKGGLTYRKDTVQVPDFADGASKSYQDVVKWVTFGVGYLN